MAAHAQNACGHGLRVPAPVIAHVAAVLLCMAITTQANALSHVDLTVTGRLTPDACHIELSDLGTIEHGEIPTHQLNTHEPTVLPSQKLDLTVICERPMLFALVGIDNRQDSAPAPDTFGLGVNIYAPDQILGAVKLSYRAALGDLQPMQVLASSDNGETWTPQAGAHPHAYMGFALPGDRQPDFISQLFTQLWVDTSINAARLLTLDQEVPLDGSIVLDLRYL